MGHGESHRRTRGVLLTGALAAAVACLWAGALGPSPVRAATQGRFGAAALTGVIRLQSHRISVNGVIRGEVVFTNRTGTAKLLTSGCNIDGLFGIGVRFSGGYEEDPQFDPVDCTPERSLVARPGRSVYHFVMRAQYLDCSTSAQDQPPRHSQYWQPLCLEDSEGERTVSPPLPAGRYALLFFPAGEWTGPDVTPARLVITRS